MRIALIQSHAASPGSRGLEGSLRLARLLRDLGHDVTRVVPQRETTPSSDASGRWRAEGFATIPVSAAQLLPAEGHFPRDFALAASRRLIEVASSFDVAWFLEGRWAMPLLRARRFRDRKLPVVVVDAAAGECPELPGMLEAINANEADLYSRRWADFVGGESELDVRGSLEEMEAVLRRERMGGAGLPAAATSPAVTVCIPYHEAPELLPRTLESLERQSSDNFTVVVVDDGSHSAAGLAAFARARERYAPRGWKFLSQENLYPGAARNRAAREADTEYLLFLDADDIAMPGMVERFLRAALLTEDDCLVAPNYGFRDDPEEPSALLYEPPGGLVGSMLDDMHGGSCVFVRRSAFWAIGGFTEIPGVGYEDYEFHVRMNLAGLRWEVLPEFIYRYRMPRQPSVSRSTPQYRNAARVRRWYEDRLGGSPLRAVPLAIASAYQAGEQLELARQELVSRIAGRHGRAARGKQRLRLLVMACYSPFDAVSGWSVRVREMLRFLASRHEVTLMIPVSPERFGAAKKAAERCNLQLRAVEHTGCWAGGETELPFRVREWCMEGFRRGLDAMPTMRFHAAVFDQIFLAEFRKHVDTIPVLSEHNIESTLLRQAAAAGPGLALPDHFQNAALEASRLEAYESRVWPEFALRTVVSEVDRREMDRRAGKGRTVVAPNGADPSHWLGDARPDTFRVLFAGHLGYLPNVDGAVWLIEEIWPEIVKRVPQARLAIAGRNPAQQVRAAATRGRGVSLVENPDSMAMLARGASVSVVPLRMGSGTRYKILESLSWGLPVVSTTLGAEGLVVEDEEHLLLRDAPEEFAAAVAALLTSPELWNRLRESGRQVIAERYCWDKVFEPFDRALIELAS